MNIGEFFRLLLFKLATPTIEVAQTPFSKLSIDIIPI